jgi:hypothetical protein
MFGLGGAVRLWSETLRSKPLRFTKNASQADDAACGILRDCFPGRRVVPVDCRVLIAGLGALHCLTQQVPAAPAPQS